MPPTGTVTFLFADIEGSTELWERFPQAMREALARHDHIMTGAMRANIGHVFKSSGDAFCVAFSRAADALSAALDAQRTLQAEPWDDTGPLRVRMALHTGVGHERDGDYFGPPLNRCARLLSAAHGGQVLVSSTTRSLVHQKLPPDTRLRDLGEHRLRDLSEPEHICQFVAPGLADGFPPILTLQQRPNNLPVRLTSFVGREREIEEIEQLLVTARLVTLMGTAGAGKTSLSLQVAGNVVDRFPDGVWFVELASVTDPALIVSMTATTLRVREAANQTLAGALGEYLRDRRALLVLDNCEQVIEGVADLVDSMLRLCPGLHFLCTSREALNVAGEIAWSVRPLALPDPDQPQPLASLEQTEAIQLFLERAEVARPGFALTDATAPAIADLCRQLDGIPLAIELAAARLKLLTLEEIGARLDDRFALLRGGRRTGHPWHRTMRGAIDWSHDLLSEPERAVFRRLSAFSGGCTLEAAEVVCCGDGVERAEVLDLVGQLVDKSLVEVERGMAARYRQLALLREYGVERLTEADEADAVAQRHLNYYLAVAEAAESGLLGAEQTSWLDRLAAEHDNMLAALTWAGETGHVAVGLRLGGLLWRFWYVRGHYGEGRKQLERLLAATDAPTDPAPERAKALHAAGTLATYQGDYDAGRRMLEGALADWRALEEPVEAGKALNNLANVAYSQGDYSAARSLYEESLETKGRTGYTHGLTTSLNNLGLVSLELGDCAAARSIFEENLASARRRGDQVSVAESLSNLGVTLGVQGDYEGAERSLADALALHRALGDREGIAEDLRGLGLLAHDLGDLPGARLRYEESLALERDLGAQQGIAETLKNLGYLAIDEGDHDAAMAYLAEGLAIQERIGHKRGVSHSLNCLGGIECARGFTEQARTLLARSLQLAREMGQRQLTLEAVEYFVCLATAEQQHERALCLAAAVTAARDRRGMPASPRRAAVLEERVAAAREVLDGQVSATVWARGLAMPIDAAVTCALDEGRA